MTKISDLAGIDPSYAERLHDDHVRDRHCDEIDNLQAENERLRARLAAAERVIEVVRARQIGTSGGVGSAMAAYDTACEGF